MRLAALRLRDFRNYARLDTPLGPGFHLLLGDNAQGKTNILEAIYLLATLRSFRGVGGAQMIRHGQKGWFVGATAIASTTHEIKFYWSPAQRQLTLDGQPVRRITDYLGTLRAVVFCSEDLGLVKGTSRMRRRFLDLLLSQTRPAYLPTLQQYTQALRQRNALLKQPRPDADSLAGFTTTLVRLGTQLTHMRHDILPRISPLARLAYRRISHNAEELRLDYAPSIKQDFALELAQSAARERALRSTLIGPHRDELVLLLNDKPAAQFGSEGQKRTLAIALKIAQAEYLHGILGTAPILLIDDVMGELDARRRAAFMPLLEQIHRSRGQVFMTCTEQNWPADIAHDLQRWKVAQGTLTALP